ncbi:hypothetical protein NPIL_161371, partial [Nephila pilipes]
LKDEFTGDGIISYESEFRNEELTVVETFKFYSSSYFCTLRFRILLFPVTIDGKENRN